MWPWEGLKNKWSLLSPPNSMIYACYDHTAHSPDCFHGYKVIHITEYVKVPVTLPVLTSLILCLQWDHSYSRPVNIFNWTMGFLCLDMPQTMFTRYNHMHHIELRYLGTYAQYRLEILFDCLIWTRSICGLHTMAFFFPRNPLLTTKDTEAQVVLCLHCPTLHVVS